jgi:large subunit ribosomal protein L18
MLARKFTNKRRHRKYRLRFKLRGTAARPRLSVFRSARHIYAQIIDDDTGSTLASASTIEKVMADFSGDKSEAAAKIGELVAHRALDAGVRSLVFDRGGFLYHGRVAQVSKAAHELGLLTKVGYEGAWPKPIEAATEETTNDASAEAPATDAATEIQE